MMASETSTAKGRGRTTAKKPPDRDRQTESKGNTSKVGNLTRDPELAFSPAGLAYARCRMAVDEPITPGDWQGEKATTFYDLTVFGEMGENFAQSCLKGCRVVVKGRAELEHWTDDEGKQQVSRKILADAVGPDLRWATAEVTKIGRRGPAGVDGQAESEDEEPF